MLTPDIRDKIITYVKTITMNGETIFEQIKFPTVNVLAGTGNLKSTELINCIEELSRSTISMYDVLHVAIEEYLVLLIVKTMGKIESGVVKENKIEEEIDMLHSIDMEYMKIKAEGLAKLIKLENEKQIDDVSDLYKKMFNLLNTFTRHASDVQKYLLLVHKLSRKENDASSIICKIMNS